MINCVKGIGVVQTYCYGTLSIFKRIDSIVREFRYCIYGAVFRTKSILTFVQYIILYKEIIQFCSKLISLKYLKYTAMVIIKKDSSLWPYKLALLWIA